MPRVFQTKDMRRFVKMGCEKTHLSDKALRTVSHIEYTLLQRFEKEKGDMNALESWKLKRKFKKLNEILANEKYHVNSCICAEGTIRWSVSIL